MTGLPQFALSIRQPWADAIIFGGKDIENRSWWSRFRGPICIHASKGMTRAEAEDFDGFVGDLQRGGHIRGELTSDRRRGGIIGTARVTACVWESSSPWFVGPYGFVLTDAKPVEFIPMNGRLGFFLHGIK